MTSEADGKAVGRLPAASMSWDQYEHEVVKLFAEWGAELDEFRITHRERVQGSDGTYVIDSVIRYRAMGMSFLVLVEAKLHGRPVERSDLQQLYQKVVSTGAHKGVLVSSGGFQAGALEFAKHHGIALIQFAN